MVGHVTTCLQGGTHMKMLMMFVLLAAAGAAGYLLGTENGRQQKELILVKMGRKESGASDVVVEEAVVS